MKNRIKELRKYLNLNQTEFGEKIGIKQGTVAGYETGARMPLDAVINSICRVFGVNEVWLRTGEGGSDNMFVKIDPEDRYSLSLGKLTTEENRFIRNAVNYLAEADPDKLKIIEDFMKSCLGIE